MSDLNWKWSFTFFMLICTIGWAAFTVIIVRNVAQDVTAGTATPTNVIESAGATFLLGAMATWMGQIIQHWFRKKISD